MRLRSAPLASLLLLCTALTGCGGDDPAVSGPATETTADLAPTPTAAAPAAAPTDPAAAPTDPAAAPTDPAAAPTDPAATAPAAGVTASLAPDPGGEPVTASGAIVLGSVDTYTVDLSACCAGEVLYGQVFSPEGNAVLEVRGPDGAVLSSETASFELQLTAPGTYTVVVGSTRGNAEYELELGVSVPAS